MTESTDVIDLDEAAERIPGGPEVLKEMAQLLVQESSDLLRQIRDGFDKGDVVLIGRGAHTLKSAADVFGAKAVVAAAFKLEGTARVKELKDLEEDIVELEKEAARLHAALRSVVDSDPA